MPTEFDTSLHNNESQASRSGLQAVKLAVHEPVPCLTFSARIPFREKELTQLSDSEPRMRASHGGAAPIRSNYVG